MIIYKNEKICSCIGRVFAKFNDKQISEIKKVIDEVIEDGVRVFLFGGLGDFDKIVYRIVSHKIEEENRTDLRRVHCFPYGYSIYNPDRYFMPRRYEDFDSPCIEPEFRNSSHYYRNCAIIEKSDWVLFYTDNNHYSATYKSYEFAVQSNKKVINFAKRNQR